MFEYGDDALFGVHAHHVAVVNTVEQSLDADDGRDVQFAADDGRVRGHAALFGQYAGGAAEQAGKVRVGRFADDNGAIRQLSAGSRRRE